MSDAGVCGRAEMSGVANTIVFVHGRNFKPPAEVMLEIDVAALAAGLERDFPQRMPLFKQARKTLAYYGDIANQVLLEHGGRYDEALDVGDRRSALEELRAFQKKKHFGLRRYEKLPGKSALPEFAAGLAAPLLAAVGMTAPLIARAAPDLGAYWDDGLTFAEQARQPVRKALADALECGDRVLLVSHGTGCIVAYDALWELSHDPRYARLEGKIGIWLSLGSPLGNASIRKRLLGAKEVITKRYPNRVLSWHNVSAEDDYTCLDKTLSGDYRRMMKERMISSVRDHTIYNLAIRYGCSNPHSSIGYFIHPQVSRIVAKWLARGIKKKSVERAKAPAEESKGTV